MNLIVLVDAQWGIGCQGEQMVYLSQDLKRFKELTQGTTVILGRKTLATFPNGNPLKNRRNLVLSHNATFTLDDAEVFTTVEDVLAAVTPEETVYVIGGASVYQLLLPHCNTAYITKVKATFPVDCFFPNLDENPDWTCTQSDAPIFDQGVEFSYCIYKRQPTE